VTDRAPRGNQDGNADQTHTHSLSTTVNSVGFPVDAEIRDLLLDDLRTVVRTRL